MSTKINPEAYKERFLQNQNQKKAIEWFLSTLRGGQSPRARSGQLDPQLILKNRRATINFIPGQIYAHIYSAKWADKLPYWDAAPLYILLDVREDSFLGVNLHYMPYLLRQKIVDFMHSTITANKWDHKTKAKINYGMIKSMSELEICRGAIKTYLFSHIQSKIVRIPSENWKMIAYLPIENFQKSTKQNVWKETRRISAATRKRSRKK